MLVLTAYTGILGNTLAFAIAAKNQHFNFQFNLLCILLWGKKVDEQIKNDLVFVSCAGAYGTVYKARDLKNPGKIVALKK